MLELQRTIGNRRTTRLIQRVVHPLDVAVELVGRKFKLTRDFTVGATTLAKGSLVKIVIWANGSPTTRVQPDGGGGVVEVPKKLLRHAETAVAGITQYDAGLDTVVRDYERGEKKIADENARRGGPDPVDLAELEWRQFNRQRLLDQRMVQETMFNRFDASIKKWVDFYGTKLGFTGKKALDPEIVKSMLFEETQMGTEGAHLDVPESNAIRTRFNIGQGPIDSGAITMVHILREEDPAFFARYKLEGIEKAMSDAQDELKRLKKLRTPNASEQARIADLTVGSGPGDQNWRPSSGTSRAPARPRPCSRRRPSGSTRRRRPGDRRASSTTTSGSRRWCGCCSSSASTPARGRTRCGGSTGAGRPPPTTASA